MSDSPVSFWSTLVDLWAILGLCYLGLYLAIQVAMLLAAWLEIRHQKRRNPFSSHEAVRTSKELPGISVLVPAYNEEGILERTLGSLLASIYPDLEILVINDGSSDATMTQLETLFDLEPATSYREPNLPTQPTLRVFVSRRDRRLKVIDKLNGGKADALNTGLNYASKPLICAVDADVLVEPLALFHLAWPFVEQPATAATSGMIRLLNGCRIDGSEILEHRLPKTLLERLQILEYSRAFSIGRMAFNRLGTHVIISGAFGLFRRDLMLEIGGYQSFSIGEDIELVIRLHRALHRTGRRDRIVFAAAAVCFTEAPGSLGELGRQRTRWHLGLLTSLRLHRNLIFRRRLGTLGLVALPYFLIFELLSPVIELLGWIAIPVGWWAGWVSAPVLGTFLLLTVLGGALGTLLAVAIDTLEVGTGYRPRAVARLCLESLVEPLGYHQMTLYFRLRAFTRFYRTIHLRGGWRPPQRAAVPEPTDPSAHEDASPCGSS